MESQQRKVNTINSVLQDIDKYIIKAGGRKVNLLRFDVGKEPNLSNVKLVCAFDRVLRTSLTLCQIEEAITDEFLEKTKIMINRLN